MTGLLVGTLVEAVTTFPPGVTQTAVFTGHTKPVSVRFAPNGQIFVGEQNGLVWAYDNLNDNTGKVWGVEYTATNDPPLVYITSSLAWTSSIDGPIGTGGSFSILALSLGSHTITAQTTDSGGVLGSDSIEVRITAELSWDLQVLLSGTGSGTVTSSPPGIECGVDCDELFVDTTAVTLMAVADPGSDFIGWGGDPDCSDGLVTMTADLTCDAQFDVRDAAYCFSFDNLCDGIAITSVLPDKTVVATWRNWDCAGATAPLLGGYSGNNVAPRLSWPAADRDADFAIWRFNLNVDAGTFDLWLHDTDLSLTQMQVDQPFSVTPGACLFGPQKKGPSQCQVSSGRGRSASSLSALKTATSARLSL